MSLRHFAVLALFLSGGAVARAGGLPEFAPLVEKQAAVVVNISASKAQPPKSKAILGGAPDAGNLPDWLRRFQQGGRELPEEDEDEGPAQGSGFTWGADGLILTNAHVVDGADEILVRFSDRRERVARLVGLDKRTDIALLKVEAKGLPRASLGDPSRLRVGDWVLAIGSPFGFESTVTAGIVSAKERWLPDEGVVPFIQTDVAINPGNSGGPLFNLKGEVVGVNSQIYSQTGGFMGLSFSIPIDIAVDVAEQLKQQGTVRRGRIGVQVQEVTFDMAESLRVPSAQGALIGLVERDSPASLAGLRVGDVISRFGAKLVASSNDLPRIVGSTLPGSQVKLQYWRAGEPRECVIQVGVFPEEVVKPVRQAAAMPRGANALGLVLQEPTREQKREAGVERGALISEVAGAAARAELRAGDLITGLIVAGSYADVSSADQLNRTVKALAKGGAVTLLVRRGEAQSFVAMRIPGR